jgi:serine protease Do
MNMMKLHKKYPIWISLIVLSLTILACVITTPTPVPTQVPTPIPQNPGTTQVATVPPTPITQNPENPNNGQNPTSRADLIKATVQILMCYDVNGELTPKYSGSGTIISSTGMILTNAHVASPASRGEPEIEPDALVIGLIDQEDQPPVFLYIAKVKAVDGYLDLAVIQITSTLDGSAVDANSLNLPFVQLGDSDAIHVGDPIDIFGFPVIGGETITFTTGNVSGFSPEASLGDRAWIKTDATISGGNSGGLGASAAGYIIGVPTQLGSGAGGDFVDCRVIQDTNGDGVVDSNDTCIPTGGFLNALRSINLAKPLIDASRSGHAYVSPFGGPPDTTTPGGGSESFGAITWYNATIDCEKQDQVNAFPSGTTAMYAAFDFSGMTDGEPWGEKWLLDGEVGYDGQYAWDQGSRGNYYTCMTNNGSPMPDGSYTLELSAGQNLDLLTQSDIVIGGGGPGPNTNQGVVTVFGQITDADSGNPLPGAQVYVLLPGITYSQWKANNYDEADLFSYAMADDQGNYVLPDKLALDVGYTFAIYADGYGITYGDNLVWTSQDPLDYQMDISLSK